MTDSELVKALENSINTYNEKGVYVDTENIQQQVLDLIKRQRAEIERLEKARQRKALSDNVVTVLMAGDTYQRLSDSMGRLLK